MKKLYRTLLTTVLLSSLAAAGYAAESRTATSPDGSVILTLTYTDDQSLQYSVAKSNREIIKASKLGLSVTAFDLQAFPNGVEWQEDSKDEIYSLAHGKVSSARNNYNELTITGKHTVSARNLTVRFRVFDDGVAFRYELGNVPGSLTSDLTEFNVNSFIRCWAQEYDEGYSGYYPARNWSSLTNQGGYCGAMLVQSGTQYLLFSEADLTAMAGSRIYPGSTAGSLRYVTEGNSTLKSNFKSAWRTIMIGSLASIVESTMIQNLMPESEMTGWEEWAKPGICAWDWGGEDGHGTVTLEQCKSYIDLAASMGWPYFLLDDGWDGRVNLSDVTSYADSKNVGVLVWSNQNRFNNSYDYDYNILKGWADQGVKGVKIDFFQGDAQNMIEKYQVLLRACADARLIVNFHGCNKPSGLERYWPHLMTTEANWGGEMYMNWGHLTPPDHGVTLAIARNSLGPMDYTPVKYGKRDGCAIANTSWAYQTALTVLFESALLTVCDCPSNLLGRESTPLLRQVPTTWDETRCLNAATESYITIARRSGEDWWLASISKNPRSFNLDLGFLNPGETYYAYIYRQGIHPTDIAFEKLEVTSATKLPVGLKSEDGIVMCISPRNDYGYPVTIRREAEDYVKGAGTEDNSWCSQGKQAKVMNSTAHSIDFNDIEAEKEGEYTLTFFYTNDKQTTAAISVNGAQAEYHTFNMQGNEQSHDPLGFTTIKVNLRKGTNRIKISPRGSSETPAFDRILLMAETADPFKESSVETVAFDSLEPKISVTPDGLSIFSFEEGSVSLFTPDGLLISSSEIKAGENFIRCGVSGMVIVNLRSGSASFSKKIIF